MNDLFAITNNPLVVFDALERVAGGAIDVYLAARLTMQRGAVLLNAPLPPNVPAIRSPYRTLVLSRGAGQTAAGFGALDAAIAKTAQLGESEIPEARKKELAVVDREFFLKALSELQADFLSR